MAFSSRVLDESFATELLAVSQACPIESRFTFRFDRDPDFFAWPREVFDSFQYVGLFAGDRLIGYCMAGYRNGWTGAGWERWAYVGDVRLLPEFRGERAMQQAFDVLAASAPHDVSVGFLVVNQGNRVGERVAHSLRAGGFTTRPVGTLDVVSLPLWGGAHSDSDSIRDATADDLKAAAALIRERSAGRLFTAGAERQGLSSGNRILVATSAGRIRGVISWRDFGDLRRATIVRYPFSYWPARIAWGIARRTRNGVAPLPQPGQALRAATVTQLAAENDDLSLLRALVRAAMAREAGQGTHLLQLGGMVGEPCLQAVEGLLRFHFRSDVWLLSKHPVSSFALPLVDVSII